MDPEDYEEEDPQEDQENTSPDSIAVQHESIVPTDPNGWIPRKIPSACPIKDFHAIK